LVGEGSSGLASAGIAKVFSDWPKPSFENLKNVLMAYDAVGGCAGVVQSAMRLVVEREPTTGRFRLISDSLIAASGAPWLRLARSGCKARGFDKE
jgi:hypothetical protein